MRTNTGYPKQGTISVISAHLFIVGLICILCLAGCGGKVEMDDNYIEPFHNAYFEQFTDEIQMKHVALYLDYSTCVKQAQDNGSPFFDAISSYITDENYVTDFYAIKQHVEKVQGRVYDLIKQPVTDIVGADIKTAAETISSGNTEAILITDGEYYVPGNSKFNENSSWMSTAIIKWLQRGHEIFIFAEPYKEVEKYNKYRYYFIFTDTRSTDNIYKLIDDNISMQSFPDVKPYHLTANHFDLYTKNGKSSTPNDNLGCNPIHCNGSYEVQVWDQLSWKDIYRFIATTTDDMGNSLPDGEAVISGLKLDRNSKGSCFRITDVDVRISNISNEYQNFCVGVDKGLDPKQIAKQDPIALKYMDNFIKLDKDEFKKHGNLDVYFDVNNFDPSLLYNKGCENLLKIDFVVKNFQENFSGKADSIFTFAIPNRDGKKNTSLVESIKVALSDAKIKEQLNNRIIYTIYVFSERNNL